MKTVQSTMGHRPSSFDGESYSRIIRLILINKKRSSVGSLKVVTQKSFTEKKKKESKATYDPSMYHSSLFVTVKISSFFNPSVPPCCSLSIACTLLTPFFTRGIKVSSHQSHAADTSHKQGQLEASPFSPCEKYVGSLRMYRSLFLNVFSQKKCSQRISGE